jgi:hypothetical protein
MGFFQYMFWPDGAPWYTGAFWSNELQWVSTMLPTLLLGLWHLDRRNAKRHAELRKHMGVDKK